MTLTDTPPLFSTSTGMASIALNPQKQLAAIYVIDGNRVYFLSPFCCGNS